MFLYIDPLKQGLKRKRIISLIPKHNMFLYIDPLKQGLKPLPEFRKAMIDTVFIHRSIKTRIETLLYFCLYKNIFLFLYIDPLKQGLKPTDR